MAQILVCDTCKDPRKPAKRAALAPGNYSPDPAGGPSSEDYVFQDFCLDCAVARLETKYQRRA